MHFVRIFSVSKGNFRHHPITLPRAHYFWLPTILQWLSIQIEGMISKVVVQLVQGLAVVIQLLLFCCV